MQAKPPAPQALYHPSHARLDPAPDVLPDRPYALESRRGTRSRNSSAAEPYAREGWGSRALPDDWGGRRLRGWSAGELRIRDRLSDPVRRWLGVQTERRVSGRLAAYRVPTVAGRGSTRSFLVSRESLSLSRHVLA
jgi:hypothetical protein